MLHFRHISVCAHTLGPRVHACKSAYTHCLAPIATCNTCAHERCARACLRVATHVRPHTHITHTHTSHTHTHTHHTHTHKHTHTHLIHTQWSPPLHAGSAVGGGRSEDFVRPAGPVSGTKTKTNTYQHLRTSDLTDQQALCATHGRPWHTVTEIDSANSARCATHSTMCAGSRK